MARMFHATWYNANCISDHEPSARKKRVCLRITRVFPVPRTLDFFPSHLLPLTTRCRRPPATTSAATSSVPSLFRRPLRRCHRHLYLSHAHRLACLPPKKISSKPTKNGEASAGDGKEENTRVRRKITENKRHGPRFLCNPT